MQAGLLISGMAFLAPPWLFDFRPRGGSGGPLALRTSFRDGRPLLKGWRPSVFFDSRAFAMPSPPDSPLIARVRSFLSKDGGPIPQPSTPAGGESVLATLMARLDAATDHATIKELSHEIDTFRVKGTL